MDQETVDQARKEAGEAYIVFEKAMKAYEAASTDWLRKKGIFQNLDYQLAMTDGRFKVIPPGQKKEKKPATLTLEQIQNIADILGIKIEEEDEDNAEEV